MTIFLIYGAVLLGYLALFLAARGGFSAAASLLCRSVFAGQRFPEEAVRKALAAGLAATLLAAALSAMHRQTDTVREGYLEREAQGGTDYEAALRVETEEGSRRIDYVVEARSYTPEEARQILKAAEERAFALALGENGAEHVAEDLHLPGEDPEAPVSFSWVSGDTELLGWDGRLADGIPAEGAEVELLLHLVFDGRVFGADPEPAGNVSRDSAFSRDAKRTIRVFPKPKALDEAARIREAITSANAPESGRVVLPDTVDGQRVRWSREGGDPGVTVLALGIVLGIGLLLNAVQKAGKAAEERQRQLSLDYPYVISRLTLYLGAGMSLRSAFVRMAETYEEDLRRGGGKREAMEEIRRTAADLRNGAPETEAIRQFGERAGNARYRTLSQLLLQHLSRGNRELPLLLAEHSREAFEERKKEARIRGEQAGTKLVFPMLLMLGVVIAILMVPAAVNFM